MAKNNTGLYLLIGLMIVVLLVSPSLINAGSAFLGNLGNFARDFINGDWTNESSEGQYMGIGMTIHFEDGTVKTIKPEEAGFLMPLTVYLDGSPITSIDFQVSCKLTWTGDLTSVLYDSDLDITTDSYTLKSQNLNDYSPSPLPSSGDWVDTLTLTLTSTEIETYSSDTGVIVVLINADAHLVVDVVFADGATDRRTGSAHGQILVEVQLSGVDAMQVSIGISGIS